jgi:hypothetical protein
MRFEAIARRQRAQSRAVVCAPKAKRRSRSVFCEHAKFFILGIEADVPLIEVANQKRVTAVLSTSPFRLQYFTDRNRSLPSLLSAGFPDTEETQRPSSLPPPALQAPAAASSSTSPSNRHASLHLRRSVRGPRDLHRRQWRLRAAPRASRLRHHQPQQVLLEGDGYVGGAHAHARHHDLPRSRYVLSLDPRGRLVVAPKRKRVECLVNVILFFSVIATRLHPQPY